MPDYRRNFVAGGTYFFTLALADRTSDLLIREIAPLRAAVSRTRRLHPFRIDAWVVLPEYMHAVWTLPAGDVAFSAQWTLIKRWFSAAIPPEESRSASRVAKGECGLWQRRFWEHTVRDAKRLRAACRLRPLRPGETWAGGACERVAVFVVPTRRRTWAIPG